jgi:DNA-directed RNA polymerase subunit RPC12/RpoP
MNSNLTCLICATGFEIETYGDENVCPSCGQRYFYDENQSIYLSEEQVEILKLHLKAKNEKMILLDPGQSFEEIKPVKHLTKNEAIEKIVKIRVGFGVYRTAFPEELKGEIAKNIWDDGAFTLGIEYGYIIALMDTFEITEREITHYGVRYHADNWKKESEGK